MQAAVWLYTPGLIPQNRSFWRQLVPQNRGRKLEASVGAPRALWTPRLAQCQVPLVPGRVRTSPVFPVKWKVVPQKKRNQGSGVDSMWAPVVGSRLLASSQDDLPEGRPTH